MAEQEVARESAEPDASKPHRPSSTLTIALVAVALIAGLLVARLVAPRAGDGAAISNTTTESGTSTRTGAAAEYESALKAGKPAYVLFHSLS